MLKPFSCAALVVLSLACAPPALAGLSPPVIVGSYYEQNATQGCGLNGSSSESSGGQGSVLLCQDLFQAPPTGKQLALDTVGCLLRIYVGTGNAAVKDVYLVQNVSGALSRKHPLVAVLQAPAAGGDAFYAVDAYLGGGYLVTAPVRIVLDVTEGSVINMECQITGTLRSP